MLCNGSIIKLRINWLVQMSIRNYVGNVPNNRRNSEPHHFMKILGEKKYVLLAAVQQHVCAILGYFPITKTRKQKNESLMLTKTREKSLEIRITQKKMPRKL